MPSAKPTLVQLAPLSVAIHSRPAPSKATLSGAANQPFSVVSGLYFAACSGASGLPALIGLSQVKLSAAWFALPSSASGGEIGRAAWRSRVWQYVDLSWVAGSVTKKNNI